MREQMSKTDILSRLYELQKLEGKEAEEYLRLLIEDVQIDIATRFDQTIGYGPEGEFYKKAILANRKAKNGLGGILKGSHGYVLTDGKNFAIYTPNDLGLPVIRDKKELADKFIADIKDMQRGVHSELAPTRAEVKYEIEIWKARRKPTPAPIFSFGERLPKVDANILMGILNICHACFVYEKDEHHPIYLQQDFLKIVVYPIP